MFTTIRTQYTAITNRAANLYQRALRIVGIQDCAEMRITVAVAVCVAIWYVLVACSWAINLLNPTTSVTALITQ